MVGHIYIILDAGQLQPHVLTPSCCMMTTCCTEEQWNIRTESHPYNSDLHIITWYMLDRPLHALSNEVRCVVFGLVVEEIMKFVTSHIYSEIWAGFPRSRRSSLEAAQIFTNLFPWYTYLPSIKNTIRHPPEGSHTTVKGLVHQRHGIGIFQWWRVSECEWVKISALRRSWKERAMSVKRAWKTVCMGPFFAISTPSPSLLFRLFSSLLILHRGPFAFHGHFFVLIRIRWFSSSKWPPSSPISIPPRIKRVFPYYRWVKSSTSNFRKVVYSNGRLVLSQIGVFGRHLLRFFRLSKRLGDEELWKGTESWVVSLISRGSTV